MDFTRRSLIPGLYTVRVELAGLKTFVHASFFGDPSQGETGPQRVFSLFFDTTGSFSNIDYGGNQTIRYDGMLATNWLVEASFARAGNIIEEVPSVNEWLVIDTRVVPFVATGWYRVLRGGE
jgi:hypothetical protein